MTELFKISEITLKAMGYEGLGAGVGAAGEAFDAIDKVTSAYHDTVAAITEGKKVPDKKDVLVALGYSRDLLEHVKGVTKHGLHFAVCVECKFSVEEFARDHVSTKKKIKRMLEDNEKKLKTYDAVIQDLENIKTKTHEKKQAARDVQAQARRLIESGLPSAFGGGTDVDLWRLSESVEPIVSATSSLETATREAIGRLQQDRADLARGTEWARSNLRELEAAGY